MPSREKTLHYLGSTLLTAVAVGLLGYGMSADWSTSTFSCALPGSNGSAVVILRPFTGTSMVENCPFTENPIHFAVVPQLVEVANAPAALQIIVVLLLVLCLLCSAATLLISLYNSVSNPYQTYMGPSGIYTCSSMSAVFSLLVLIFQACHVFLANVLGDVLVKQLSVEIAGTPSSSLQVGYYMTIPYLVLSLAAIAVVYKYQHMAYRHQRKQQKPTEDAPKEIMMY